MILVILTIGSACENRESSDSTNATVQDAAPVAPPVIYAQSPTPSPSPIPRGAPQADLIANRRASHVNGSAVRVTKVIYRPDRIGVVIAASNGTSYKIKLNNLGDDLILRDDIGNVYDIITPSRNPELEVAARGSLNGTFYFEGPLHRAARSLTLTTNERLGSMRDVTTNPKMKVTGIPVPK